MAVLEQKTGERQTPTPRAENRYVELLGHLITS
jgi:hypothetical protein